VTEYVSWASGVGYLRIDEIERELAATTGIARGKLVLIDGVAGDFKMDPPKHGKPLSIDVIDVKIDEGS
jgi:hypothetical protein